MRRIRARLPAAFPVRFLGDAANSGVMEHSPRTRLAPDLLRWTEDPARRVAIADKVCNPARKRTLLPVDGSEPPLELLRRGLGAIIHKAASK
jgi:hypothetical protein